MEEKNSQKKRSETKYITPLTIFGSAIGAGSGYMITFPIATVYGLAAQMPNIGDGRLVESLYQAVSTGSEIGGYAALVGGVAGLLTTAKIRKGVGSLFGKK
jgi:Na+/H+ antiporter NhaD/arsenite permease-like protein